MDYMSEYKRWLDCSALSADEHAELAAVADNQEEIESRFFAPLSFGTAGLRGVLGVGLNRMNRFTVGQAAQGLANLIVSNGQAAMDRGVAIAYDSRHFSAEFAKQSACIMAANGIQSLLFDELRPTPELSFAVRHYGCIAGINITASHNPKEYNGYKVYDHTGGQIVSEFARRVSEAIASVDPFDGVRRSSLEKGLQSGSIEYLTQEFIDGYIGAVLRLQLEPGIFWKSGLKIAYSPLNGAGHKSVIAALSRAGLEEIYVVADQSRPNGDFPTCPSPNPENPDTMKMTLDLGRYIQADIAFATDPDSDRVGIMVRSRDGSFIPVTGNQTGVLMLDYLIGAMRRAGKLPEHPYFLKTIVTTEMARKVAEANGVTCCDTFTGFKFMAEKKNQLESQGLGHVIMSYEESYGYMLGDYVRDKDAVTASLILTEMAAWYAVQGMTLFDALEALYRKYGFYGEKTHNLVMPGLDGLEKMAALMKSLRADPPTHIAGVEVLRRKDYTDGSVIDCRTGEKTAMELSGSNVLRYELADGTTILVRPSGTEPKIKVYILTIGKDETERDENLAKYSQWVATLTK